jgi:hypothetical protein
MKVFWLFKLELIFFNVLVWTQYVATLILGSQPKQGLAKVWAKREVQESHLMLPKM